MKVSCIGTLPVGVSRASVASLVAKATKRAGRVLEGSLTVRVTDDRTIRALNRRHRGKDKVTDVLSFSYVEGLPKALQSAGERELGDIVISLPQVKRQAKAIGRGAKAEFLLMVVHGTLHLLGHDHETLADERRMFRLQHDILIQAGIL